ncbi:MAG: ABC transporter permease, partial [Leptolyngbyaceae cyanobacterium bins.59]|nr:ABC transporter permease [Leptolyngbyaceae cyanobacterium bins.59]
MDVVKRSVQRFWRSLAGKWGLILTLGLVGVAVLAPLVHPYDPTTDRDYLARLQPPSLAHFLGTDGLGRDLLVLVWYGIRTSL